MERIDELLLKEKVKYLFFDNTNSLKVNNSKVRKFIFCQSHKIIKLIIKVWQNKYTCYIFVKKRKTFEIRLK